MYDPKLVVTADGSHSLYLDHLKEHYHSHHGAIQESVHVYINAGLRHLLEKKPSEINCLEVGFGTGLNALLTLIEAAKNTTKIHYHTLEPYPLALKLVNSLNYLTQLQATDFSPQFETMHQSLINEEQRLHQNFLFKKTNEKVENIRFIKNYDLVYFDAFAPSVQPELWAISVFEKIFAALSNDACLVTYCAKGAVKRNLKQVGFAIESLPGPKGKREIIRAVKK
jgi:tRNA U34 5-methylaminomethyl-2-thiouridine-forming methyltransferase MnmC